MAAGGEHEHVVAILLHIRQRVGDDEHDTSRVGELPQHLHHRLVERRVKSGRRLVEDEQFRPGEQLDRGGHALALAAGQSVDAIVAAFRQFQFGEHVVDDLGAFRLRRSRQTQFRRVFERRVDGELAMHDVVLRYEADTAAQQFDVLVHVVAVEYHMAFGGGVEAGDDRRERRFAGAGRSDHGGERALCEHGVNAVEQTHALADGQADVLRDDGVLAAERRTILQHAVMHGQIGVADRDHVAFLKPDFGDAAAGHIRAVRGVEVGQEDAVRRGFE